MAFGDCDCWKKIFFSGIPKEKHSLFMIQKEFFHTNGTK